MDGWKEWRLCEGAGPLPATQRQLGIPHLILKFPGASAYLLWLGCPLSSSPPAVLWNSVASGQKHLVLQVYMAQVPATSGWTVEVTGLPLQAQSQCSSPYHSNLPEVSCPHWLLLWSCGASMLGSRFQGAWLWPLRFRCQGLWGCTRAWGHVDPWLVV